MLPSFDYVSAKSVQDAVALFSARPDSRYFAGGTDLLPQMRARGGAGRIVDVKGIADLKIISETEDGGLSIGAAVPLAALEAHPAVRQRYPALLQCCREVGAWPLRNRATLAGNICNASPAADTAVALLALDADVCVLGAKGPRTIPVEEFFVGPGKTALGRGELVTHVLLPASTAGAAACYLRLSRRRGMDLATVGVLAVRCGESVHPRHRLALAAVSPTPMRVAAAERMLDKRSDGEGIRHAAELARKACSPITDVRGSADYRREMVGVLAARALSALG